MCIECLGKQIKHPLMQKTEMLDFVAEINPEHKNKQFVWKENKTEKQNEVKNISGKILFRKKNWI